jgi:DNA invertase Pin-like site-specific DNA recombinase
MSTMFDPAEGLDASGMASSVGAKVGYAGVSTAGQFLDRQLAAPAAAECIRVFADKKSGKNVERGELWMALDYLRPGDTLVVTSLDRLGRSLADLISIVSGLSRRSARTVTPVPNWGTATVTGRRGEAASIIASVGASRRSAMVSGVGR